MKAEYINPFIKSIDNAIQTTLNMTPEASAPYIKKDNLTSGDVSGVIGFADKNCLGAVALSFPAGTAVVVFNAMMGGVAEKVTKITPEVQDAVGELANIVAGGATSEFSQNGINFNLAIPTVVLGRQHKIIQDIEVPTVVVPMKIDGHPFAMEICMKIKSDNGGNEDGQDAAIQS